MIIAIHDVAPTVVAFKAIGEITKKDYDSVVIPSIDNLVKRLGKIRFLLLLDTEVKKYNSGAWFEDALAGVNYFSKWHKMAIISDQEVVRRFTRAFSFIAPGEAKVFLKNEFEKAKGWVAS